MSEFQQKPPFFMVYNSSTGYARKRHNTPDEAQAEAERLAALFPYSKFHVIMSLGRATGTVKERREFRKTPAYQEHLEKKAERRAAKKERLEKQKALADETNKR